MRRIVCVLASIVFGLAACRSSTPAGRGPNIVLVSIDTLRSDHVGVYGATGVKTPTLDALAARGVRFAKVIASAPLTLPSHATMFTGLYPPHHGVRHNGIFKLDPSIPTLAERLRDAGYTTAAVVASEVLDSRYGLDRGFETYDDAVGRKRAAPAGYHERRASEVTERAIALLAANPARPFFLFVHYYDPHSSYEPPEPYASSFRENPYDGEIAYVDASVGQLVDALRSRGLEGNTILAVTSDHGEGLGEHGETTHGYLIYDCTLSVPLILAGPGIPAGHTVPGVVTLADLTPTLLSLAGLPPLDTADGRDLSPAWHANAAAAQSPHAPRPAAETATRNAAAASPVSRDVYAECLATMYDHGWSPLHAMRGELFYYVRAPRPELYGVQTDPRELNNLLETQPGTWDGVVSEMEKKLRQILASERADERAPLDAETRERLNALGYNLREKAATFTGLDPKDGIRWVNPFLEALQAYDRGAYHEALRLLDPMITASPESSHARALVARVYLAQGNAAAALPQAQAAVRLDPACAGWHEILGEALEALGRDDEAESEYEIAVQLEPDRWKPRFKTLERMAKSANRAALEREADRFARDFSDNVDAQAGLCNFWFSHKRIDRAIEAGRRAVRIDPTSKDAHMLLAVALTRAGRDDEAEEHLRLAGSAAMKPKLRNQLAVAYAERGELDRAGMLWEEIHRSYPNFETVNENLVTLDIHRTARAKRQATVPRTPTLARAGPRTPAR